MTAVEWLEEQTRKPEWHSLKRQDILEQAKEMEKQQIIDAWIATDNELQRLAAETYYNETYKKP
jgi:hypothetical protein